MADGHGVEPGVQERAAFGWLSTAKRYGIQVRRDWAEGRIAAAEQPSQVCAQVRLANTDQIDEGNAHVLLQKVAKKTATAVSAALICLLIAAFSFHPKKDARQHRTTGGSDGSTGAAVPAVNLDAVDVPLKKVVDYLRAQSGVPVFVNWKTLAGLKCSNEFTVTAQLHGSPNPIQGQTTWFWGCGRS